MKSTILIVFSFTIIFIICLQGCIPCKDITIFNCSSQKIEGLLILSSRISGDILFSVDPKASLTIKKIPVPDSFKYIFIFKADDKEERIEVFYAEMKKNNWAVKLGCNEKEGAQK